MKLADPVEELAAKFFGQRGPAVHIDVGAMSHAGKVRSNNEDHFSVVRRRRSREVLLTNLGEGVVPRSQHDDVYTLAVADGIGGAAFGEFASMLALRTGWDLTSGAFKWHFLVNESEAEELKEFLKVYGQLIHRRLLNEAVHDPRLAGMGTTITCALTIGLEAFIAHAGDSRAYIFRDGNLQQLTRDHTLAQQLVDAGAIPSVSAASRRMQNMLVNCLGGNRSEVEVDVHQVQLASGDRLLLCTDGLTDMVAEQEIAATLLRHTGSQTAAHALVELALDHGGRDNVTVVVACIATADDRESPEGPQREHGAFQSESA
jgi:protein phosphatase